MRTIDADALKGILHSKQIEFVKHPTFVRSDMEEGIDRGIGCALLAINDAPTVGGWISVKERMPEEDSSVLVWEKQGFAFVDWYKFGVWQLGAENGAIITHWMPLPEPPKEERDDS